MMTHLLVDFDGFIVALQTNVAGRIHDSNAARHNKLFKKILSGGGKKKFALGDPGYAGVEWVVSGFKTNQLKDLPGREKFDDVSRSEQAQVEHVNNFIKKCKVLSKSHIFVHSREKHIACVFIVCGWYNFMKERFGKF
jgi:hypothetical protein